MGAGALGRGLGLLPVSGGYVVVVISVFGGFGSLSGHQSISANRSIPTISTLGNCIS